MSKPAGKCIFCGQPGLTKGHVWPDWLNNILPRTATHHEVVTGEFSTFTPEVPVTPKTQMLRQGHARARKPRNTCSSCNSGWMSQIEDDVIPTATHLIKDEAFMLDDRQQCKLAAFLCLISMRLEFSGHMRATPASDHQYLMKNRKPPASWLIWIAKYAGDKPDEHWSRYSAVLLGSTPADKVGPEYCNTQCTTLVMGKLCAHLYSSTQMPIEGYEGIRLTRIWPLTGWRIDTRFLPALSDDILPWLHEAVARETPPLPKN
jgi:hypothetical protein